jgi:spoIIIJ-associated protein
VVSEPHAADAVAKQVQEEKRKRMNDERVSSAKRVPSKEFQRRDPLQAIPRLDRDRAISELNRFLGLAMGEMNLALEYQIVVSAKAEAGRDDADLAVTFSGADQELLLEKEAELLLALEHIAHRWLRLDPRLHDRVRFDCGDYRATRLADLKLSARVAAQRVRETGQPFQFNPMSPRERRIVHLELNGAPGVRTASEGTGDRRQLVIYPATKTKS